MTNAETIESRGAGAIVASSLGLLLLALIFLGVGYIRSPAIELKAVIGPTLEPVDNPSHGMEVLQLERLNDGRLVALFGYSDDLPPEKEMGEEMRMGMGGGRGKGGRGMRGMGGMGGMGEDRKPDPNSLWLKVPAGETGQAPWQAVLVHYPSQGTSEKTIAREFGRLDFKDLSTLPKHGGSAVLDSGHVVWHGFRVPYVITRHFRMEDKEPVFHDSLRFNLTRGVHSLVLYMRWRPGHKAELESARPLLDAWTLSDE